MLSETKKFLAMKEIKQGALDDLSVAEIDAEVRKAVPTITESELATAWDEAVTDKRAEFDEINELACRRGFPKSAAELRASAYRYLAHADALERWGKDAAVRGELHQGGQGGVPPELSPQDVGRAYRRRSLDRL
jgi:hypothetical protein